MEVKLPEPSIGCDGCAAVADDDGDATRKGWIISGTGEKREHFCMECQENAVGR